MIENQKLRLITGVLIASIICMQTIDLIIYEVSYNMKYFLDFFYLIIVMLLIALTTDKIKSKFPNWASLFCIITGFVLGGIIIVASDFFMNNYIFSLGLFYIGGIIGTISTFFLWLIAFYDFKNTFKKL